MVSSLKGAHSQPLDLYLAAKEFLRVFTDAANHIPRHRRNKYVAFAAIVSCQYSSRAQLLWTFGWCSRLERILCSHLHVVIGKIGKPRHPTNISGRCSRFALSPDFRVPTWQLFATNLCKIFLYALWQSVSLNTFSRLQMRY